MKKPACRRFEEALGLEALGELRQPAGRDLLEAHLRECAACRAERERLTEILAAARRAAAAPAWSPGEVDALCLAVRRRLPQKRPQGALSRWRDFFFRPLPALAVAGLLLAFAVAGLHRNWGLRAGPAETEMTAEWVPGDLEVLRHLDLLQELETIERLVHLVDLPEALPAGPGNGAEEERQERGDEGRSEKAA